MFEAVVKHSMAKQVIDWVRLVTKFIYDHNWVVDHIQKACSQDLVRLGATQFTTNYIALKSFTGETDGLKNFFLSSEWMKHSIRDTIMGKNIKQIVCAHLFWDYARESITIMEPMHTALREMNNEKGPTLGLVYAYILLWKKKLKHLHQNITNGCGRLLTRHGLNQWTYQFIKLVNLILLLYYIQYQDILCPKHSTSLYFNILP